jgi:hypothetical protein
MMEILPTTAPGIVPACHGKAVPSAQGQTLKVVCEHGTQEVGLRVFSVAEVA